MTNRQLRRYEMLFRVTEFGAAHRDRFPESSRAGRAFAAVANAVNQLRDRAVAQLALKREGARERRAARAALLDMLESISRTARVIEADEPTFPNTFPLPDRRSAQAVLTAARLSARNLEAVAQQFIEHGMPETFVAEFKRLFDTYEQAVGRREIGKGESAAARASIDATIESALTAARRLDVIVGNQLREDAAATAAWERGRRVPYTRRVTTPTTPTDSAPAPVVSPPAVSEPPPVAPPPADCATPATTTSAPPVPDVYAA